MLSAEASRAKHKFAVKRNSWPKTRGVAMNPVDHVRHYLDLALLIAVLIVMIRSLTVVETISISAKLRQSHEWHLKDKKQVSSPRGEPDCYGVLKRPRIRWHSVLCLLVIFEQPYVPGGLFRVVDKLRHQTQAINLVCLGVIVSSWESLQLRDDLHDSKMSHGILGR